jgi:hypothetical protein
LGAAEAPDGLPVLDSQGNLVGFDEVGSVSDEEETLQQGAAAKKARTEMGKAAEEESQVMMTGSQFADYLRRAPPVAALLAEGVAVKPKEGSLLADVTKVTLAPGVSLSLEMTKEQLGRAFLFEIAPEQYEPVQFETVERIPGSSAKLARDGKLRFTVKLQAYSDSLHDKLLLAERHKECGIVNFRAIRSGDCVATIMQYYLPVNEIEDGLSEAIVMQLDSMWTYMKTNGISYVDMRPDHLGTVDERLVLVDFEGINGSPVSGTGGEESMDYSFGVTKHLLSVAKRQRSNILKKIMTRTYRLEDRYRVRADF